MPTAINNRRTPIWRKTITLFLLPVIIPLWMTGWILTQIGSQENSNPIRQKTVLTQTIYQKNDEPTNPQEDSQIPYQPQIIA